MKFQVDVDGQNYTLELQAGPEPEYRLTGAHTASGKASLAEVQPGVFSVLLDSKSFTVYISARNAEIEVWHGAHRRSITLADARDRSLTGQKTTTAGPMQVRAQMPGRVIKLLVELGSSVRTGQGVIVIEAMKMQNEVKAPKDGIVSKIQARENSTVAAGETLMIID